MSQVPRDQDGVGGQGEFQEGEVVRVWQQIGRQRRGQYPGGQVVQALQQSRHRPLRELELRTGQQVAVLVEDARIQEQRGLVVQDRRQQRGARPSRGEDPRDDQVGVEDQTRHARALRTALISDSISWADSAGLGANWRVWSARWARARRRAARSSS